MSKKELSYLKDLTAAYELALEYDYCPEPDGYAEYASFLGRTFDRHILTECVGCRSDEIARMIIQKIKELK